MRRSPRQLALVVLAAPLLCAACGSSAPVPAEPALGAVPVITSFSQVTRPIDRYLPTSAELRQLYVQQVRALTGCAAAAGVPTGPTPPPAGLDEFLAGAVRDRVVRSPLYGFFDTERAGSFGFQRPPQVPETMTEPLPPRTPQKVAEGCLQRLEGDFPGLSLVMDERSLPEGGPVPPTHDSRFLQAVASWRDCMAGRGFRYTDPNEPIADPRWSGTAAFHPSPMPSAEEVRVATADVECKVSSNLVGVAAAVQQAYDRAYVTRFATRLDSDREHFLAVISAEDQPQAGKRTSAGSPAQVPQGA